jgi:hypothetical protein
MNEQEVECDHFGYIFGFVDFSEYNGLMLDLNDFFRM